MNNIGRRIRYFRELKNITQVDLESEMDAASGFVSRIESNKVNPTKETLLKISQLLNLNSSEQSYLIGPMSSPANQDSINNAVSEIEDYYKKRDVFAYLIDDRFRFVHLSHGFYRFFSPFISDPEKTLKDITGISLLRIMLDDNLKIAKFMSSSKYFEELLVNQISRFYYEMGFMIDDPHYQEALKYIRTHPLAWQIWRKVAGMKVNLISIESRIVNFKIMGMNIKLAYSREKLYANPRFESIEYTPTNKLLRFMSQLA
jgi:transcriptional regulator with XRE-family HTH domain